MADPTPEPHVARRSVSDRAELISQNDALERRVEELEAAITNYFAARRPTDQSRAYRHIQSLLKDGERE